IWYEYVSGENHLLIRHIDEQLKRNKPFTPDVTQQLYEKYVLMDMPERLNKTNNGLRVVVDNTLENIHRVESETSKCTNGLSQSQSELEKCEDISQLKSLVTKIIDDSRQLTLSSNELHTELSRTTQEIMKLREELETVKHQAESDFLTGLHNRGAFNKQIQSLCDSHTAFSLVLFDIDKFKRLNDKFGHLLGDKVLQFFASLLKQYAGERHFSARFGGEEMVMLFMGSSMEDAFLLTDTIRRKFADSRLQKKGSTESIGQVTVSAGISSYQYGDSPFDMIERADKALYESKTDGRNRINFI
ncbi:hypothetical protein LCGC14_0816360, partial [marine sediment metagenome]